MNHKPLFSLTTLLLTTLLSGSALAQRGSDEPIEYKFDDDDLLGEAFASDGDIIRLRLGPARTLLLRPRASFVSEMLQSVEHL
jgi:hypothetical protein